jgi:hypothetical protein
MSDTGVLKHIIQINDLRSNLDQGLSGAGDTELKVNQIAIALGTTGYRLLYRDELGGAHDVANLDDIGSGPAGATVGNINLSFGTTGTVISTGIKADVTLPFNLAFTSWRVVGQPTGSVLFTLTSYSYANYPYTGTGHMIPGYTGPYVNNDFKNQATSLVGWTGSSGDILEIVIDSCSNFNNLSLSLGYSKV